MIDRIKSPADLIQIQPAQAPGWTAEHHNLIHLSLEYIQSTVDMASVCLAVNPMDGGPSNELIASMLSGVETHIAVIRQLASQAGQAPHIDSKSHTPSTRGGEA